MKNLFVAMSLLCATAVNAVEKPKTVDSFLGYKFDGVIVTNDMVKLDYTSKYHEDYKTYEVKFAKKFTIFEDAKIDTSVNGNFFGIKMSKYITASQGASDEHKRLITILEAKYGKADDDGYGCHHIWKFNSGARVIDLYYDAKHDDIRLSAKDSALEEKYKKEFEENKKKQEQSKSAGEIDML